VTAWLALELGREIFAVPGRLFDELAPAHVGRDGPRWFSTRPTCAPRPGWIRRPSSRSPARRHAPPSCRAGRLACCSPHWRAASRAAGAVATRPPIDQTLALLLELELGGQVARSGTALSLVDRGIPPPTGTLTSRVLARATTAVPVSAACPPRPSSASR
jgi:predicted Rossmann fold nucleotide-binding protein DprA/Smf involved in DNA uptake